MHKTILIGLFIGITLLLIEYTFFSKDNIQHSSNQNISITNNQTAYSSSSNRGSNNVSQTNNQSININYNYSNK